DLRIEACGNGSVTRLAVFGEVDAASAPELEAWLSQAASAGCAEVVLDLSGLEFIDSSGLSVLVSAHKQLRDAGAQLVIASPPPPARRIFDISGLDRVLTIR
ncbi:MAG: STAS domain-containing protein, partial [Actinobacteria bacterium]|nr:STAS domain-containing protein [Actinomycetota bacterium]